MIQKLINTHLSVNSGRKNNISKYNQQFCLEFIDIHVIIRVGFKKGYLKVFTENIFLPFKKLIINHKNNLYN